jgi:NAD(P)-dependent dehydrogenase (short-subunit alcohol dehydrogenase family)
MGKLQGKVAVFTGGTQGIGFTTAKLKTRDSAQARTVVCVERPRGVSRGGTE